jgi:hypothetical protein
MKYTVLTGAKQRQKKKNPQHGRQRAVGSGECRRNVSSLFDFHVKYEINRAGTKKL